MGLLVVSESVVGDKLDDGTSTLRAGRGVFSGGSWGDGGAERVSSGWCSPVDVLFWMSFGDSSVSRPPNKARSTMNVWATPSCRSRVVEDG